MKEIIIRLSLNYMFLLKPNCSGGEKLISVQSIRLIARFVENVWVTAGVLSETKFAGESHRVNMSTEMAWNSLAHQNFLFNLLI